jgi:DNA repair exonuclease SbcCD ATPase subunit
MSQSLREMKKRLEHEQIAHEKDLKELSIAKNQKELLEIEIAKEKARQDSRKNEITKEQTVVLIPDNTKLMNVLQKAKNVNQRLRKKNQNLEGKIFTFEKDVSSKLDQNFVSLGRNDQESSEIQEQIHEIKEKNEELLRAIQSQTESRLSLNFDFPNDSIPLNRSSEKITIC